MGSFYELTKILDELKNVPNSDNLKKVLSIIKDDETLCLHFYGADNKTFPDFGWVELLFEAGEFDDLNALPENCGLTDRFKADFIKEAACEKPEIVFEIITTLKPKDAWIQRMFLESAEKMQLDLTEKTVGLIWDYLGNKQTYIWRSQGERAAKIMIKLMDESPSQAFAIARLLLEIWRQEESEGMPLRDVYSRFRDHEYSDLIFKHYRQVCEKCPYKGVQLLIQILDGYFDELNTDKDYDSSEMYYIRIKDLNDQNSSRRDDVIKTLVKAICQFLQMLKERGEIDKMLKWLEASDKAIFRRIEIYYLSRIEGDTYKDRIREILLEHTYFRNPCYANECNLLLNEKGTLVYDEIKPQIEKWLQDDFKVDDRSDFNEWFKKYHEKEPTEKDIKIYEDRRRASRLYPIQAVFGDLYERYKQAAEASEEEVKPFESEGARYIAGDEGTPLTTEQMNEMGAEDVLDYILNPEHYNYKPKGFQHNSPAEALGYAFQMAVKARPVDFVKADTEKFTDLSEPFISRYFYGLWDALRENKIDGFDWDRYFKIAQAIVDKHKGNNDIATQLVPLVECIQVGFKGTNKIEYETKRLNTIFSIIEPLLSIKEERDVSDERDPMQVQCNTVGGEVLRTCLSLGVIFKRDFNPEFEGSFKSKLEAVFDKVLTEIKTSWMVCTFGSDFPRIYWLVPKWVKQNLGLMLSEKYWDTVWGTYLHWGRPSKKLFEFLSGKGVYEKAIEKKDDIISRDSSETPAEELARHFVIAYCNGWIKSYEDELLQTFLSAANDELLGYAANFFTTGFESQKKEPKEGVNDRLKTYWEKRLEIIAAEPDKHFQEASALASWIKDCPLEDVDVFNLEEQTLSLCNGKLEDDYKAGDCIKALCSYVNDDNRLRVIRTIRRIVKEPPEYMDWENFQKELGGLLDAVVKDEHASQELMQEAMGLANDLGRLRVYDYKEVFEKLSKRLDAGSSPA